MLHNGGRWRCIDWNSVVFSGAVGGATAGAGEVVAPYLGRAFRSIPFARGLVAADGVPIGQTLKSAAGRAIETVGPGKGAVYGTRAHTAFEVEVNALGNPLLSTERSYLNGSIVNRSTAGSVRLDVVHGPLDAPIAIYDLKTGSSALSQRRIDQILSHLPPGSRNIPVLEIKP